MNAPELKAFMRQISKEKDLDVEVVKEAIEQAIVQASKRNLSQFDDARVQLDAETGELQLFVKKTIARIASNPRTQISARDAKKSHPDAVEGDEIEVSIDPSAFGRIAAQSARQIVMQKLKEAERNKVHTEYSAKTGELYSGIVVRFERRDIIVNIGKNEAVLPRNETPITSKYKINDRIKVVLMDMELDSRGPVLRVSRNSPLLVQRLFEQEVPEIADGTVKIVNVVREPGARTKIAVQSTNSDVDPVGACVGVKGSRVQMIVREMENEKVDIVPFTTNSIDFIRAALVPAQIKSIEIDEEHRRADVIVKEGNLSLAIGKRGQNAKLAAKLTGWKLDIHSEGEDEKMARVDVQHVQHQYLEDFLTQIEQLSPETRDAFYQSEFNSVNQIAESSSEQLGVELLEGDTQLAEEIIEGAREYVEALAEMTRTNYGEEEAASAETAEVDADKTTGDGTNEDATTHSEVEAEEPTEESEEEVNDGEAAVDTETGLQESEAVDESILAETESTERTPEV